MLIPNPAVMCLCSRGLEAVEGGAVGLVLGRERRVGDRLIYQRARAQLDPLVSQLRIHIGKDRLGQPMTAPEDTGS